jgi:hypothetical protein
MALFLRLAVVLSVGFFALNTFALQNSIKTAGTVCSLSVSRANNTKIWTVEINVNGYNKRSVTLVNPTETTNTLTSNDTPNVLTEVKVDPKTQTVDAKITAFNPPILDVMSCDGYLK